MSTSGRIRRRLVVAIVLTSGFLVAIPLLLARPGTSAGAESLPGPDAGMLQGLAANGLLFESQPTLTVSVSADAARTTALSEYGGKPSDSTVYLGLLTDQGRLDSLASSGTTADIPVDRPVFAVQIEGLAIARVGAPTPPDSLHHEYIVFIDAMSGQEILTTTFR